ncbi:hypothetical protein [Methanoculleus sp.]|uniref:hypothetical protein n=1 Tax=Methanoculleus sp. TaxID=90427 RepID=UPI0025E14440|nr:hypothetical protein [Methanoculleus sp.]
MNLVAAVRRCKQALSSGDCRLVVARDAVLVFLFLLAVPLLLGLVSRMSPLVVFTLIVSTLVLQATAAVVGLSLGLHPVVVLALLTSVAVAVMIGVLEVCHLFAGRSRLARRLIRKTNAKTGRIDPLRRYGVLVLIPTIWIPGIALYGTPVVSWLFRYPRIPSLLCMVAGWVIAVIVIMAATIGLVRLLLPASPG